MSLPAQPAVLARRLVLCAAAASVVVLSGCAGGFSLTKEEDVGLSTASVPQQQQAANTSTQMMSDQSIIRNAVSAADLASVGTTGVAWANSDTGSRGSISGISEYAEAGSTCRKFVVSRESFDGVNIYDGDACLIGGGAWKLRAFKSM